MRRRPEAYHERMVAADRAAEEQAIGSVAGGHAAAPATDAPASIHDILTMKEPGLVAFLHYDQHERRSGLVHLLPANGSTDETAFTHATYDELGDFTNGVFEATVVEADRVVARRLGAVKVDGGSRPLILEKTFRFEGGRTDPSLSLEISLESPGDSAMAFEMAVEWNVNMLGGGHNPAAYYESNAGERTPHDMSGEAAEATKIAFGNDYEGVRVVAHPEPAARLTWYPVETVSNSEAGFERVYQGSSLLFRWPVSLAPGSKRCFTVAFDVTQSTDRAAAEAAGAVEAV
jgi:alpha-amylase